ncbi:hypothetical protein BXZ70DRAFT_1063072 [Cristinia sonorae]|uniref:DUF6534 domain-containing protein n=1 Tax=Cristinia sonorae TaxID=1940300 RepID=A0A8K0UTH5_9AGAR|nr:hypothetical protein BXZ70DRAFT_1063072 [Cristinia sonorae]
MPTEWIISMIAGPHRHSGRPYVRSHLGSQSVSKYQPVEGIRHPFDEYSSCRRVLSSTYQGSMASLITSVFGGFVIESYGALIMYGVISVQAYMYSLGASNDPLLVKCVAIAVWITETLQTGFMIHSVFYYTVQHYGEPTIALSIVWSVPVSIVHTMSTSTYTANFERLKTFVGTERAVVLIVHSYYLLRIWALSNRSRVLVSVLGFLLVARIAFSVEFLLSYENIHTWAALRDSHKSTVLVVCTLTLGVVTDVLFAIFFTYYILRDRTGFRSTDNIVQSMVKYTVNTGILTLACSIVILVTYLLQDERLTFLGFIVINSKLYANSFFAIVNASHKLRAQAALISNYSTELRTLSTLPPATPRFGKRIEVIEIRDRDTSNPSSLTSQRQTAVNPRTNSPTDDILAVQPFDISQKFITETESRVSAQTHGGQGDE